jgi:hypothetical protein
MLPISMFWSCLADFSRCNDGRTVQNPAHFSQDWPELRPSEVQFWHAQTCLKLAEMQLKSPLPPANVLISAIL